MPCDQKLDQRTRFGATRLHCEQCRYSRRICAFVGRFSWIGLSVDEKAMLEIVNSKLGRLWVGHRAQVTRDFEMPAVRLIDRSLKLRARDVHIGFERSCALISPESNRSPSVLGRCDLVHLDERASWTLKVEPGHVDMRPNHFSGIDLLLDVEVGIRLDASCRAHRRHAIGEVEPRRAEGHLGNDDRVFEMPGGVNVWPSDVKHVIMHSDKAWKCRLARSVEASVVGWNWRPGPKNGRDF